MHIIARNALRIEKQGAIVARSVADPAFYIYIAMQYGSDTPRKKNGLLCLFTFFFS